MPILKINLLPPRIKQARNKRLMILGVAVAGAVLLTIPAGFWYMRWTVQAGLRSQIKAIEAESASYAGIIDKVTALETQETALESKLAIVDKLLARQARWIRLMETLSQAQTQAKDLWLIRLATRPLTLAADAGKTELAVDGRAFSAAAVADFVKIMQKADLGGLEVGNTLMANPAVQGQLVIEFKLVFKIKV